MAEGKKEKDPETEDSVKLFVGQVPKHMAEAQLLDLFQEFARVDEVNVIRDKSARASRGCCFVTCPSREEADKAITAYHNKLTLPGASSPLQVKYANGELERLEHKLFIGMLPKNVSEEEVSDLFSTYGTIKDMHILKGSQQTSKGCAFVKYETKEQAVEALNALNGKHKMEGSSIPLVVKWADTEKERQARRAQKALSQVANIPNTDLQNPSLFGALPMSYIPSYNGYGYQAPGSYRLMQYRIPPMQNHFQNMIPPVTHQRNNTLQGTSPEFRPRNYGMSPTSYMPNVQYPPMGAYHGGMLCQRLFSGSMASTAGDGNSALPTTVASSPNSGGQIEGPPGANLFIYHIPQEYGDQELANAFRPFGQVLSAKVFVDKATGASKCFGFVSYDSSEDAQSAINNMNGHQLGGNKLKVQLKRDNRQNKPY